VGISSSEPGFKGNQTQSRAETLTERPILSYPARLRRNGVPTQLRPPTPVSVPTPRGNPRHDRIFFNQKKIINANLRLSLGIEPPEFQR
jgi:hypothetical protein